MSEKIATPQQIDRDLAEKVMGFTWIKHDPIGCWKERLGALRFWFSPTTFRDDAHEVLAKLTDEQWIDVGLHLYKEMDYKYRESGSSEFEANTEAAKGYLIGLRHAFTATPAQISLAVWRAVCQ